MSMNNVPQQLLSGMITVMLAKFMLNDVPHAAGIVGTSNPGYERPPTINQLHHIARLRKRLKVTTPYEKQVDTFAEAGRMIRELETEKAHRAAQKSKNPTSPTTATIATGKCYETAWRYIIQQEEGSLVHGTVTRGNKIKHAWVELPSGYLWEPQTGETFTIDGFYKQYFAEVEDRYTTEEAAIMAARTHNLGPWEREEIKEWLGR